MGNCLTKLGCVCKRRKRTIDDKDTSSRQYSSVNIQEPDNTEVSEHTYSPENSDKPEVKESLARKRPSNNSGEHRDIGEELQRYSPANSRELVDTETLSHCSSINSEEHIHIGAGALRYSPENSTELVDTETLSDCYSINSREHSHIGARAQKHSPENSRKLVDTEILSQCSSVNSGENSHIVAGAQKHSPENSRELVDTETLSNCYSINSGEHSHIVGGAQKHSPETSRELVDTETLSQYSPVNSRHLTHSDVPDDIETESQKHALLNSKQKEKLGNLFQHIISNAQVDFSNREFKDIRKAVHTMLARIRDRVNMRGIFDIASVVPTGSTVEYTSLWKFGPDPYLEFDFLAKLRNSIHVGGYPYTKDTCQGCIDIETLPVRLDSLRQYYHNEVILYNKKSLRGKRRLNDLFVNEINQCLTVCGCLFFKCNRKVVQRELYTISFLPSQITHKQNCKRCTVDMPTGTLLINSDMSINQRSIGPNKCSEIFKWQSKINILSAPDRLLLQRPKPITSMPIYVDFIPSLEPEKLSPSGAFYKHDYLMVPKNCNICPGDGIKWRKSWCMTELNVFKTEMSVKHKNSYKIIKYFSETIVGHKLPSYHIKTLILRHHTKCSDTANSVVDCVMEIICDLHQAYDTKQLLDYKTNLNMLGLYDYYYQREACEMYINKLCSMSEGDKWETFIAKMQEISD